MARQITSKAMALPSSHISRTQSELQLCKDIAIAEWHDDMMFDRLVKGIKKQAIISKRRNRSNDYASTNNTSNDNVIDQRIARSIESIVRHHYEYIPYDSISFDDKSVEYSLQSDDSTAESQTNESDDDLLFDMDDI